MKAECEIRKINESDVVTASVPGCTENCNLECGGELE